MKNIRCLRKDIITAKKCLCSLRMHIQAICDGYMEAEEGVAQQLITSLPARGFCYMQPNGLQPCWAVLLSAHTVTGAAPLPLSPEGPGTKVVMVIVEGSA